MAKSGIELLDCAIAELEAQLNLQPGQDIPKQLLEWQSGSDNASDATSTEQAGGKTKGAGGGGKKQEQQQPKTKKGGNKPATVNLDQPDICKLEFKVGQIVKVRAASCKARVRSHPRDPNLWRGAHCFLED